MYKIILNYSDNLKDGRTITSISETLGISIDYLSRIFNQKVSCKKVIAMSLISLKEKIYINDSKMEELLEHYFEKVA